MGKIDDTGGGVMNTSCLQQLKIMKRKMTYAKMSQCLGVSENNLIRWLARGVKISPAYEHILRERLGDADVNR